MRVEIIEALLGLVLRSVLVFFLKVFLLFVSCVYTMLSVGVIAVVLSSSSCDSLFVGLVCVFSWINCLSVILIVIAILLCSC